MGLWCGCTVDGNLPDRPRCPCSPTVRQLNRQTARPATRRAIGSQQLPRAASGPSLWPSYSRIFLLGLHLGYGPAQSTTTGRSPRVRGRVRAGGSVSRQRRWRSLVGRWSGAPRWAGVIEGVFGPKRMLGGRCRLGVGRRESPADAWLRGPYRRGQRAEPGGDLQSQAWTHIGHRNHRYEAWPTAVARRFGVACS
jgi:hypothetical protein